MSKKKTTEYYVADFETTAKPQFEIEGCTRVYLWYMENIYKDEDNSIGCSIDEFYKSVTSPTCDHRVVFFHNLTYDILFFEYHLNRIGIEYVQNPTFTDEEGVKIKRSNVYTVVRDEFKSVFQMVLYVDGMEIEFRDSLKLLMSSVDDLPNERKIEKLKDYDYKRIRTEKTIADFDPRDIEYCKHDVWKVKDVLHALLESIGDYLTIGASSYATFKRMFNKTNKWNFRNHFPSIAEDDDTLLRKAYNGGLVILNGAYKEKIITDLIDSYDRNSMYPSEMRFSVLPFGEPIRIHDVTTLEKLKARGHCLFVWCCDVEYMRIKDGFIPFIQKSKNYLFSAKKVDLPKEITNTVFYWTNVDLDNIRKYYDIKFKIDLHLSYSMQGKTGMFDEYVDTFYTMKQKASEEGKVFEKMLAKYRLNTLYGKFATRTDRLAYASVYEGEELHFDLYENTTTGEFYLPMGIFITSYSRSVLIKAIEAEADAFVYCDTDSIHVIASRYKNTLEIHATNLGAWKSEGMSRKSLFFANKQYIKEKFNKKTGSWEISQTIASLNKTSHHLVNFENMKKGSVIVGGKKVRKHVQGGYIIEERDFTFL